MQTSLIALSQITHKCRSTSMCQWGAVAQWLERATDNRVVAGSNPAEAFLITLAISFTTLCQCLSEETLKAVGPFYLVSMLGEVKYPIIPHSLSLLPRGREDGTSNNG